MSNPSQSEQGPEYGGGGGHPGEAVEARTNGAAGPGGETDEERSFGEPGRTSPVGEGGGSMSGRAQENPGDPETSELSDPGGGNAGTGSGLGGGLATPLQPGGTVPGGGPAVSQGAIGTGGGQTGGARSGSLRREGG